jgi:hypothetical protein
MTKNICFNLSGCTSAPVPVADGGGWCITHYRSAELRSYYVPHLCVDIPAVGKQIESEARQIFGLGADVKPATIGFNRNGLYIMVRVNFDSIPTKDADAATAKAGAFHYKLRKDS